MLGHARVSARPAPDSRRLNASNGDRRARARAVAQPRRPEWERGLEPRSMSDARQLSHWMHQSQMFSAYGRAEAVLSTMLLGRELGIPAMAALR